MTIDRLSDSDRSVIGECLVALRRGRYLDEDDIVSRIGVSVATYDALAAAWPAVDDSDDDSDACLVVNNALNEVCHGVHIPMRDWPAWFTVPKAEVKEIYRRWADLRGWDRTGVR
jgi:hypothetical protein